MDQPSQMQLMITAKELTSCATTKDIGRRSAIMDMVDDLEEEDRWVFCLVACTKKTHPWLLSALQISSTVRALGLQYKSRPLFLYRP